MLISAFISTTFQGTAIKERIQERLQAQSRDFSLLQYDKYDSDDDDADDDEDVEEDIAKVVKLVKD
jgi:hypothetical protein